MIDSDARSIPFPDAPTLRGERVVLEQLDPSHAGDLAVAAEAGELWRTWYTLVPHPDAVAAEIDRRLAVQAEGSMAPWAIVDAASGRAVGMTTFMNLEPINRRVEIGYTWLGKAAQGTGINAETKLLLLTRAFETLDCIAVEFRTHWHNRQSRAAIASLGAKQDGVLRNHQIDRFGAFRDTVVFSIIASEWPTVKQGLEYKLASLAAFAGERRES